MSFACLKMFGLPSNVVFLWYLCENKNIHWIYWNAHIFPKIFAKMTDFYQKMTKIIGFQAKIEKTRFYTIWEPCFIYKCDFWSNWASRGVLQSLCGIFHFLPFSPILTSKCPKFCIFCHFFHFSGPKWAKMTKYGKFPHNVCKTPLEG